MLKEREFTVNGFHELEPVLSVDAVVVGSGIMGLMVAKRLSDLGQRVVVLEPQSTFAYGASIKNHGWLHRGTAHSVSIKDKEEAKKVVRKLVYGYEFFSSYASECIEEPFSPIFALTQDDSLAQRALELWEELGINNREVSREKFYELDPSISRQAKFHIFETADLQINNRMLFKKLINDIGRNGGMVIKGAGYEYESENQLDVIFNGVSYRLNSDVFIYATGANLGSQYKQLTGNSLEMSYWKSHLIYLPRFSPYSIFSFDRNLPIIINHQDTSVINRAYDEVPVSYLDYQAGQRELEAAFESACYLYPELSDNRGDVRGIACIKPSLKSENQIRHSVNSQIIEPLPKHYFVLPGKMTETPFVADELLHHIYNRLDFSEVSKRPIDLFEEKSPQLSAINQLTAGQKV